MKESNTFTFNNKKYEYFDHSHHNTFCNERRVEIPIIWDIVQKSSGERVLEVGNTLSHYFDCNHDVVDKYEKGDYDKLHNIDIIEYANDPYDLVVSISTLEHIGWDNALYGGIKSPEMVFPAFANLKKLCKGMLVWTHPWGYNTFLDKLIEKQIMPMTAVKGMIRVNDTPNLWKEVEWLEVTKKEYGKPFRNANGLLIIWTDYEQLA